MPPPQCRQHWQSHDKIADSPATEHHDLFRVFSFTHFQMPLDKLTDRSNLPQAQTL